MFTASFNILKLRFPYAMSCGFSAVPRINSDNFLKPFCLRNGDTFIFCEVRIRCLNSIYLNFRLQMVNAFKRHNCYAQYAPLTLRELQALAASCV
jgi:hypothetical protein